jgi:formamidopyrimidine-DNA glycosylase
MPELPEVETVRAGLNNLLPGRIITAVAANNEKSFPNAPSDVNAFLVSSSVVAVRRRAKVLLVDLSSEYTLVIHLKMTGQLVFVASTVRFGAGHPNDSLVHDLPDKSTRVEFTFQDGSKLFFNDQRKFGWVKLMPSSEVMNIDFMRKVGPEPLATDFTSDILWERLQRRKNTTIKAALLDQTVLAGIGNIYADESLWGAKVHPVRRVKDVSHTEVERLFAEIQYVLNLSIQKGGSSNHTYVNAEGKRGSYMSFARVFRREGQACPRCGTIILKTKVAGRGTHFCPHCQKT